MGISTRGTQATFQYLPGLLVLTTKSRLISSHFIDEESEALGGELGLPKVTQPRCGVT